MSTLTDALAAHRLIPLGHCPHDGGTLILVGPDEPHFWPVFTHSPEYQDGSPDALDRWSTRVLTGLAETVTGKAIFPFGGPPFHPFYTWALETGRFFTSPIGFLVHDKRGLFASFRGAIWVADTIAPTPSDSPCPSCAAPCASACPVGAFDNGYDVAACKAHINSAAGANCIDKGCRARRACPIGQNLRLPAQAEFHMKAFQ